MSKYEVETIEPSKETRATFETMDGASKEAEGYLWSAPVGTEIAIHDLERGVTLWAWKILKGPTGSGVK